MAPGGLNSREAINRSDLIVGVSNGPLAGDDGACSLFRATGKESVSAIDREFIVCKYLLLYCSSSSQNQRPSSTGTSLPINWSTCRINFFALSSEKDHPPITGKAQIMTVVTFKSVTASCTFRADMTKRILGGETEGAWVGNFHFEVLIRDP